MGGKSSQTQSQSSNQNYNNQSANQFDTNTGQTFGTNTGQTYNNQFNPWGAVAGPLTNLVSQISSNQGSIPNFGSNASGLAGNLLSGLPNFNQTAAGNLATYKNQLSPFTNPNYLDPMSNPYTKGALGTMNQDITNQITSMFAAAGRDLSPDEAQALARGLSQGEAQLLLGQYNTNAGNYLGATGNQYNASNQTNQGILGNATAGLGVASGAPSLYNNVGSTENMLLPLAGIGGTSSGTGTGTTSGTATGTTSGTAAGTSSGRGSSSGYGQTTNTPSLMSMLPGYAAAGQAGLNVLGMLPFLFA